MTSSFLPAVLTHSRKSAPVSAIKGISHLLGNVHLRLMMNKITKITGATKKMLRGAGKEGDVKQAGLDENKLLTQTNARGLCPRPRKPRKGLINTDG